MSTNTWALMTLPSLKEEKVSKMGWQNGVKPKRKHLTFREAGEDSFSINIC